MKNNKPDHRSTPRASVVIASIVGPPFIDDCLRSIERQAHALDAEVIVVACGTAEYARRLQQSFPWIQVVHRAQRETVPELRRAGVEHAQGDVVAIIEEHCLADSDWLRRAVEAHASGDWGAVGGPVLDHAYPRLRDWVVYFCEYNGYLPPWQAGEVTDLNGANIVYRRDVLLEHKALLGSGYWEASLHPRLLAKGIKFRSIPDMTVRHRGPFNYGYYLQQRYWFSRAFAGHRAKNLPAAKRLMYLLAAPLIPALLLARMAGRVYQKRCRMNKFIESLPLVIPALAVYVAGEWVGYLAGPGDALSRVE
jgi:glycosyltransferase involved in cell wall biosynthesis